VSDILVFEPPVEKAKTLKLELPADDVGEKGTFRFSIAQSYIARP
jgi:hypothetical protein